MSANEETNNEARRTRGEDQAEQAGEKTPKEEPKVPLFLRDKSDGRKGNAQDEKDATGE